MRKYKLLNNVLGWITFLIASTVYLLTIEPSGSFWDCGEFVSSAYKLEVGHPPGAPFFMLIGNLFTQLMSDPAQVVNSMSALFSGLTILFLFWTITHLARKIIIKDESEITIAQIITILGSGLVGALVYTFSDTFWFSAVEGEVYAFSSLFTALVFWLILKWEDQANLPHADRWIVLIAYLMGLSIGVHLLNLLCIPAIVLVYYYKKFPNPNMKGTIIALLVSFAIVALMMYGVVQGLVEVCGYFELLFVNVLGMPYNTGVYAYVILLAGVLAWAIYETMRDNVNETRLKISFLVSIVLLGIPFIGSGYILGAVLILALAFLLYKMKRSNVQVMNTILVSLLVIVVGYSSYALILIRSSADTPMNQNDPKDIFTLRNYLAREQYGETPLVYGDTYVTDQKYVREGNTYVPAQHDGSPTYSRIIKTDPNEKDRYFISYQGRVPEHVEELNMLFPRMYSQQPSHIEQYKSWAGIKGKPVTYDRLGEKVTVVKPTFAENLRYFFNYQLNYMYWRYFMWNFSGRQNDIQGQGDPLNGNWITGIGFIDEVLVGPADHLPFDMEHNKGHNVFYLLPLLLGLIGLFYQANSGQKGIEGFWITFFLFFMTGIAIVLYLNQTPLQPRERDYAYAGSFYAFCIWIGFGVAGLAKLLEKYARTPVVVAGIAASLLCLLVPIQMAGQTWDDHDRSGRYTTRDYGQNYLQSCEPNAIIFTNGDNDTFPLWYAQEVEGIRTDVRVCNTSYLQTDWYINQMKRQTYTSDVLPISWGPADYIQGTRDAAMIIPAINQPMDLKVALDFVRSNDPRYKKVQGYSQPLDYVPSQTLKMKVDSAAAVNSGTISPKYVPYMVPEMTIDLTNKNYLGKQELIILDMLQTNNWQRPMYYAITVSSDQYVRLDPYFQQTGMAYRIVPMETAEGSVNRIDTEKMYDNIMNKFKWGGVDKPGIYLDETVMRMCKSYRLNVFSVLVKSLIAEGQNEKALAALDKCMEVLPPENVPLDISGIYLGEYYYALGAKEKAEQIYDPMAQIAVDNLRWYQRLRPAQQEAIRYTINQNMYILQQTLNLGQANQSEFVNKYKGDFENFFKHFSGLLSGE
ncbi:membrane protein [Bacteroidia bacterium]|nr:membrane protein [Bacteroidia bacterium]